MNAPHTLAAQLAAALAQNAALKQALHAEQCDRVLAERRLLENAQGGPRYARNLPELPPTP